jgi:uncharacterized membrane protein
LSGELFDFAIPAALGVVVAASISSMVAYACLKRRATKTYAGCNVLYWCGTALILARLDTSSQFDPLHFMIALITVAPLILLPGLLLLFCVIGKLGRRAVFPAALVGALVAVPLVLYAALISSCYMLHDCP